MTVGLSRDRVVAISQTKNEPTWMRDWRLACVDIYNSTPLPNWGPALTGLDVDQIETYVQPRGKVTDDWSQIPSEIRETFAQLGIPQAEEKFLAGVSAQYDSELVYHRVKEMVAAQGVIYEDLGTALVGVEAELVRAHFMQLITPRDHKFAALHGAVWSGGSYVHVPAGEKITIPLQSYFRLNAKGAGQFEHTLIIVDEGASLHFIEGCSAPRYNVAALHAGAVEIFVGPGATVRYSTIENWSKNIYNLNTKRAQVAAGGTIEWVSGSFGSGVTCLYPESLLAGEGAAASYQGVTLAGAGQVLDTGVKMRHLAARTTSTAMVKSLAKNGGAADFRSSVYVAPEAVDSRSFIQCDSLLLDDQSHATSLPAVITRTAAVDIGHEARVGKISDETINFLRARGLSESQAYRLVVNGFVDDFARELPLEYAVEMMNLVNWELSRGQRQE